MNWELLITNMIKKKTQKGFTILEILLAISLFLIIFLGISYLFLDNLKNGFENQERIKAEFLAQEGLEAVWSIADDNFFDLQPGSYGLSLVDNKWHLIAQPENISGVLKNGQRLIEIESLADNLFKVKSNVAWQSFLNHSKNTYLTTILGNWQRNLVGNWQKPEEVAYYRLIADARSVFHVGNYTYIGTLNFFGEPDFYIFDTSDLNNPVLLSTLDLGARTWATVNSIYVVGDYAYLATTINGREFVVVDISDPYNPVDVAYQTTQTLIDATGVHVSGQYAYLTNLYKKNQKQLYVFDISDPLNPDFVSRINLAESAYNLTFENNFVYIASGKDNQELQIIDVSQPQTISLDYSLDLPGENDAYDIFVSDNIGYVVRAEGFGPEFMIIDLNNKSQPQVISSLDLDANFKSVYLVDNYVLIGGDKNQEQFQVIDVNDLSRPEPVSSLDVNGIVYDLVSDGQAAYLAIGGGEETDNGLKIIIPTY